MATEIHGSMEEAEDARNNPDTLPLPEAMQLLDIADDGTTADEYLTEEESLREYPGGRHFHVEAYPEAQRTAKELPSE
jgi:hypothetical protein